jgi:ornithine cyclodeaminase/alanine dehydrogenase-like protein (mu-crystallin family)
LDPARKPGRSFAAAAAREFHIDVSAVDSAHDAVCGHAIVILATRSRQPVIDAADVSPGAHVVTVGPKSVVAHETPLELIDRASIITCDSANQAAAYPEAFFTGERELVDLGAVILGEHPGRTAASDITVHCSVGLAGTEVLLADLLIARQPGADEST